MRLTFLSADTPLVKTLSLVAGDLKKTPYPMVRDFTSHTVDVHTPEELHAALAHAAEQGWCLLKGNLSRRIQSESRAGLTSGTEATQLLVLDYDGCPLTGSLDAELDRVGLGAYDYVLQPSASSVLPSALGRLSAHVFIMLEGSVTPAILKSYLYGLNLSFYEDKITLTKAGASLHWPVDPSVCDNSKLIYIAPPVLQGELRDVPPPQITRHEREQRFAPLSLFSVDYARIEADKTEVLNRLRKAAGYKAISPGQYKQQGEVQYLARPGKAVVTGKRVQRGFVYLNLNGGDSWGYWHPENSPEFIFNFKGEPTYKTSELLPDYYEELKTAAPSSSSSAVKYFVCRDFRSDRLYNGVYDPATNDLVIARAANEKRLQSFLKQHGRPVGDFIPDWVFTYDPTNPVRWDEKKKLINFYKPSALRQAWKGKRNSPLPPMVARVLGHAVGKPEVVDHFLNAMACIVQYNIKLLIAWVLHGGQGTGKGLTIGMMRLILGDTNVFQTTMGPLLGQFNGFLETCQLVAVDEAQLSATREANFNAATLRSYITEQSIPIRHMFSEPYIVRNYANFIFCSNMPDPVSVPQDDRRYNVGDYQPNRLEITTDEIKQFFAEAEAFFDYLMCYPADIDRANSVLQTESRAHLQYLSRTAAGEMVQTLVEGDFEDLWLNKPEKPVTPAESGYCDLVNQLLAEGPARTVLTRDELLTIFRYRVGDVPESPNRFTSYLKHNRMHTIRLRKGEKLFYGIHIHWKQDQSWFDTLVATLPKPGQVVSMVRRAKVELPAPSTSTPETPSSSSSTKSSDAKK